MNKQTKEEIKMSTNTRKGTHWGTITKAFHVKMGHHVCLFSPESNKNIDNP